MELTGRLTVGRKGEPAIGLDFDGTLTIAPGMITVEFREQNIAPLVFRTSDLDHFTVWVSLDSHSSPTSEPMADEVSSEK